MIAPLSDRADYPTLFEATYLNQASLGLTPQPAIAAMHRFLDDIGRHGNLYLSDAEELALVAPLRGASATLMNCPPERLAIVAGASELLSQLPYLLPPVPGRSVLCVASDFPAITRPWLALAARTDTHVHFVDDNANTDLTDALLEQIRPQTGVVAVSHVQFSTGTVVDIPRLRAATRAVGASLVVDVTQSAGALPIDATAWDADAVVSSGYKWLGGQGGIGLAALSPELAGHTPPMPGWMGAPDPFDTQATRLPLADGARRFTQSTLSYATVSGLACAIEALNRLGPNAIAQHAAALAGALSAKLGATAWRPFRAVGSAAASPHIVTLAHPAADAEQLVPKLRNAGVVCSARQGRVRVSLAHYNTCTDLDALVSALQPLTP